MKTESELQKICSLGNLAIGKINLNEKSAYLISFNNETKTAVILEKYLKEGYQINEYNFSQNSKRLIPKSKPEIIDKYHKEYEVAKKLLTFI